MFIIYTLDRLWRNMSWLAAYIPEWGVYDDEEFGLHYRLRQMAWGYYREDI